ncbi:hypothetical protein CDD81_2336 [Ophiocordyceps australis]|uniref:GED domain-containing protein n=1 Tax=Ophiocordyceps australis TaxID=1399860 RepID=A0A2C5XU53_9HYPO|nr:hypothetical protein CDD81_2336 [Ophiocordyceps australis]
MAQLKHSLCFFLLTLQQQNHFTVIDLPGNFEFSISERTTDTDVIQDERNIQFCTAKGPSMILPVIHCSVDDTHKAIEKKIVHLAKAVDSKEYRTIGVLTNRKLASDMRISHKNIDLALNGNSNLEFYYCVVKDQGTDGVPSSLDERLKAEESFFQAAQWLQIHDHCGMKAFRKRLSYMIKKLYKEEFSRVKTKVEQQLDQNQEILNTIFPPRNDNMTQRMFLGNIASKFEVLTHAALNANYSANNIFDTEPNMRLISQVKKAHMKFAVRFAESGHNMTFDGFLELQNGTGAERSNRRGEGSSLQAFWAGKGTENIERDTSLFPELQEIIRTEVFDYARPTNASLMKRIGTVYQSTLGPHLETLNGEIISILFREQVTKWKSIIIDHVSDIIYMIHRYIFRLLCLVCPEEQVCKDIWNKLLVKQLCILYQGALGQAKLLVDVECHHPPATFKQDFDNELRERRHQRNEVTSMPTTFGFKSNQVDKQTTNKDNDKVACEDVYDALEMYYKVARDRLVDNIYRQVIMHKLLEGQGSPVKTFGTYMIMGLDDDELMALAGETEVSQRKRMDVACEIVSLKQALVALCMSRG